MLDQNQGRPVPSGELGPYVPGGLGDGGRSTGFGDHRQVAGLRTSGQRYPQVSSAPLALPVG
jgi:hypothetical protein